MNVLELRTELSKCKTEKQSLLNDTYMWVKAAREAIINLNEDKIVFEVPGTNGRPRKVKREKPEILKNRIVNKDIYNSAYVMMISLVEDYFNKIMKLLLFYDNNRIKCTISNASMQTSIDIVDFIDNSKEEMISQIIYNRIDRIFYATPQVQLDYMDKALGINIKKDEWYKWIEYKARRDVIIHNNCIVNEVYSNKVNGYGRYKIGDTINFSESEFAIILTDFKSLIGQIDHIIRQKYHIPTVKEAADFISKKDMEILENL